MSVGGPLCGKEPRSSDDAQADIGDSWDTAPGRWFHLRRKEALMAMCAFDLSRDFGHDDLGQVVSVALTRAGPLSIRPDLLGD